jgi:methylenetetrahydrofolate dehydrogenase (NADP+) / methenyltetrahydrofolate cyclohydrolase
MTAQILDGQALSARLRGELKERVARLTAQGKQPGLAVIIAGEDPASRIYVRNKIKACAEAGIHSQMYEFPASVSEPQLLERIQALNEDPRIHGILVQLPLPRQIDESKVLDSVDVSKDVDGFHLLNLGGLVVGRPRLVACTPAGCMALLDAAGIVFQGKEAVVVGRSNIVGKPMALLLLHRSATVTICTSKTRALADHTRRADILVVATGKPRLIAGDMIKEGAAVVDVGMNRLADGRLVGDVDFAAAKERAAWITPVPGGVGPMTITMLLSNTVRAAETS